MIPAQAIEKAIEGGWRPNGKKIDGFHIGDSGAWMFWKKPRAYQAHLRPEEIALDPSFWQALAKTTGYNKVQDCKTCGHYYPWKTNKCPSCGYSKKTSKMVEKEVENVFALPHRFYDLILTHQPTDAFWEELLTKPLN